jgi:hypothetical protein
MVPIKDIQDFEARKNRYQAQFKERDELVRLCREMYEMRKNIKSGYLGADANKWRSKVPAEYWESSNRPFNVVNVMTAILSGHEPQYKATVPGLSDSTAAPRAEKFLSGAWFVNSRKQGLQIYKDLVMRAILDGAVGVRVWWDTEAEPRNTITVDHPDMPEEQAVVWQYDALNFPIIIETVKLDKLYYGGRSVHGQFSELLHIEKRSAADVEAEWDGIDGANLDMINEIDAKDRNINVYEYSEYWSSHKDKIYYAVIFNSKFIIKPKEINYPRIPYIIAPFMQYDRDDPNHQFLPFLFGILWPVMKEEYVASRSFRILDLFANMPPVFRGNRPISLEGTWGKGLNLQPDEKLEFISWPGSPPDVYRLIEDLRNKQSQGTFSEAMFGQVSSRLSGYGLSQLIGTDTLRTDLPRADIELALCAVADLIFALMRQFAPGVFLSLTVDTKANSFSAMLNGEETEQLMVSTFIKPKQTSDEVRMASLGAQLASLPNPPVSTMYILEHYFGINQPEEEIQRKLSEDAMKDPLIRLMALAEVLSEMGSPYAQVIQQQLEQAIQKAGGGQQEQQGPPSMDTLGLGMPQATMGNPPVIPPSGNPSEEVGPTLNTMMMGGPMGEM